MSNNERNKTIQTVILTDVNMGPAQDCPGIVAVDMKGLNGRTTRYLASVEDWIRLGRQINAEGQWLRATNASGAAANDDTRRRQRR